MKATYWTFGRNGQKEYHWTRKRFIGWCGKNLIGAPMAAFSGTHAHASVLYIPEYCLTPEAKAALPKPKRT